MDWDAVNDDWNRVKSRIRRSWGRLTDADLESARGRREEIVGRIQRRYGMPRERAERAVDTLIRQL